MSRQADGPLSDIGMSQSHKGRTCVQRRQAGIRAGTREAGWAPLRDPSLRSGSLRSAQPASRGEGITETKKLKGRALEAEGKRGFTSTLKCLIRGPENGVHLRGSD